MNKKEEVRKIDKKVVVYHNQEESCSTSDKVMISCVEYLLTLTNDEIIDQIESFIISMCRIEDLLVD